MDITFLMLHKNIKMVFIGMKVCTICGISKELNDFNNQKLGKFGKRSYCRLLWKHENLIKSNKMLIKN
jgi:predicted secreted protein